MASGRISESVTNDSSYYGTTFFTNSGIKKPFLITIATNVVNAGSTPFGMWASDKVGRRPLMMIGAAGMAIAQLIVAITGTAISQDNAAGQKVLVAVSVTLAWSHLSSLSLPLLLGVKHSRGRRSLDRELLLTPVRLHFHRLLRDDLGDPRLGHHQ